MKRSLPDYRPTSAAVSDLPLFAFDGATYDPDRDGARLGRQLEAVRDAMADGSWHTLAELAERAGGSVASVSARIRDLRKPRFGGHEVERQYVADGVWRYRMTF